MNDDRGPKSHDTESPGARAVVQFDEQGRIIRQLQMDVDNAVPLSTSERMSRQMTVLRVANGLMAEHDGWQRLSMLDIANAAVDVLIDDATLMPSERWDEECHRCEQRIGDHLVDGRCPTGGIKEP